MQSPSQSDLEFETLLNYLKDNLGCDLTGYKRSTLKRRFQVRMQSINIDTYQDYFNYLQLHSQEYIPLLDEVLINFTHFFRDRDVWDYLATDIIPTIIANKQPDEPIRVWSAGCATGQEIYSLLMLLAEILGRESCFKRVKAYATDIDEVALIQARKGVYTEEEITEIPPNLLKTYFQRTEQGYVFDRKLRQTIIVGRHDLAKDAPMSKIDLLICRNVLIYFNQDVQNSILTRFYFSLKNTGFLVLGQTEFLLNSRKIFTAVNLKYRINKKGLSLVKEEILSLNPKFAISPVNSVVTTEKYFWQTAFVTSPIAQFAVDLHGDLVSANEQANHLFELTSDDLKCSFSELEPGKLIYFDLKNHTFSPNYEIESLKNIAWQTSSHTRYFDITISPVLNSKKQELGSIVAFIEQPSC